MILDELTEHLTRVQRYENYISALCPFHEDTRPSLLVWSDYFRCYSCGANGRPEQLLQKVSLIPSRLDENEIPFVNPWTGWLRRYKRIGIALKYAHKSIQNRESVYLANRGIPHKAQKELKLGYLDGWYTIPIFNQRGKIEGAVARAEPDNPSPAKYVSPKGQKNSNLIYVPDWSLLETERIVYLTFGIIDAISLYLCGVASISTVSGVRLNTSVLNSIRKIFYIIPDRKEEKFAHELASKLGWRGHVLRVNWLDGIKDVNDLFITNRELLETNLHGNHMAGRKRGSSRISYERSYRSKRGAT